MPAVADRVRETTATVGTGAVSLSGAVTGFQAFQDAFASGAVVYYCIAAGAEWEVGSGAVTTGVPWTLARTTILASSNADALVNFSAGVKDVFCTLPEALVTDLTDAGDTSLHYHLADRIHARNSALHRV